MTLNIIALSTTTFSIMALDIMVPSMTVNRIALSIATISIMTFGIMMLNIITPSIVQQRSLCEQVLLYMSIDLHLVQYNGLKETK